MKEIIFISMLLITATVLLVIKDPPDTLRTIIKRHNANNAVSFCEIGNLQKWVAITLAYFAVMLNACIQMSWRYPHEWSPVLYCAGIASVVVYVTRNILASAVGDIYASKYRSIVSGTVSGNKAISTANQQLKNIIPLWYINLVLHTAFVSLLIYIIYCYYI